MAKAETLKDKQNNVVYPVTKADITYLSDNVTTVEEEIEKIPVVTVTTVDPGEGADIGDNELIAVVGE